jgi:DNA-binding GntR family transcriptional regulator
VHRFAPSLMTACTVQREHILTLTGSITSIADESSRNLSKRAYDQFLDMMLNGELLAGTLLQERTLAEKLGISRTPVREALARLETEGFVKRHSGRFLLVREMPVREIIEILQVRTVLEVSAIESAIGRIPMEGLKRARAAFESQIENPRLDADQQRKADDLLHGLIVDACNNVVLAEIVRKLRQRTHMFNLNNLPERFIPGTAEHLAIIDALERCDVDSARRAMSAHLENVKLSILNRIGGT